MLSVDGEAQKEAETSTLGETGRQPNSHPVSSAAKPATLFKHSEF